MAFGNSAKFLNETQVPKRNYIFSADATKNCYEVLETFHGELYQAELFGENARV